MSVKEKKALIKRNHEIPIYRQCELLGLSKSAYYYGSRGESAQNLELMRLIDEIYTKWPFYGVLRITKELQRREYDVNEKRVRRLMRKLGLEAVYPKPNLSRPDKAHKIYPYLLKDLEITHPDHVWCTDITYIRMEQGFVYLVAVMDWYSRYVRFRGFYAIILFVTGRYYYSSIYYWIKRHVCVGAFDDAREGFLCGGVKTRFEPRAAGNIQF